MASPMRQTRVRRAMKKAARGKRRKNHLRQHGSTPPRLPMRGKEAVCSAQTPGTA